MIRTVSADSIDGSRWPGARTMIISCTSGATRSITCCRSGRPSSSSDALSRPSRLLRPPATTMAPNAGVSPMSLFIDQKRLRLPPRGLRSAPGLSMRTAHTLNSGIFDFGS